MCFALSNHYFQDAFIDHIHMVSLQAHYFASNFFSLSHDRLSAKNCQEKWLKDAVLTVFPDTRGFHPSLVRFILIE